MTNPTRAILSSIRGGVAREVVAHLIIQAFPKHHLEPGPDNAPSRASRVLGISDRHIRRLLKQEHDAAWPIVMTLIVLVGFERALALITGE